MNSKKQKNNTDDKETLKQDTIEDAVINLVKQFSSGKRFYSVRELAKMLGINRGASELILKNLVLRQILFSVPSKGYFVADNYLLESPPPVYGDSSFDICLDDKTHPHLTAYQPSFEYFLNLGHSFPDPKVVHIEKYLSLYGSSYRNYHFSVRKFMTDLNETARMILLRKGMFEGGQRFCVLPCPGLFLLAEFMVSKGTCVVLANWGDADAEIPFLYHGAEVVYTGSDAEGMLVGSVEQIGKQKKIGVVIIRPFCSIPFRRKLSSERIAHLLGLAAKMDFMVLSLEFESDLRLHSGNPFIPYAGGHPHLVCLKQVCNSFFEFKSFFVVSGPENLVRAVEKRKNKSTPFFDLMRCLTLVKMEERGLLAQERKRLEGYYEGCLKTLLETFHSYLGNTGEVYVPADGLSLYIRLKEKVSILPVLEWMTETGLFCAALNKHTAARVLPVRSFILHFGWPEVGVIQHLFMKLHRLLEQSSH